MLAIINHHYIRRDFKTAFDSIFGLTPFLFEKKLKYYLKHYNIIQQHELLKAIREKTFFNNETILLTFDDGLKEQYVYAYPILKKYNCKAIFFINTKPIIERSVLAVHKVHIVRSLMAPEIILNELNNFLGKNNNFLDDEEISVKATSHYKYDSLFVAILKYKLNFILSINELDKFSNFLFKDKCKLNEEEISLKLYMSESQIKDLGNNNMIGSHSHDHIPLGLFEQNLQLSNVSISKKILEDLIGFEVLGFSYPYGNEESCQNMAEILSSQGYEFGITTERKINGNLKRNYYLSRLDNNDTTYGKNYNNKDLNFFTYYNIES